MPSLSVSQKTFELIADAAITCYQNNEIDTAEELDKVARRINAALSNEFRNPLGNNKGLGWEDVPSVLEHAKKCPHVPSAWSKEYVCKCGRVIDSNFNPSQ